MKLELLSNSSGNWDIYRMIEEKTSAAFIIRFPKMNIGETKINSYINNYKIIHDLGLPTLVIVEKVTCCCGKLGIKTEDLNYSKDTIYVTHNSVYSDSRKKVDELSQSFNKITLDKKISEYEEFRYRNKLKEITNFYEFIKSTKEKLKVASEHSIHIDYDSYFFGTSNKSKSSEIDYKIVDLDNIFANKDQSFNEIHNYNINEFHDAINGFIKYFVESKNQSLYYENATTFLKK
ncbi:hypothetical protein CLV94_0438 [Flavobacterium endophyticum]|uniref:Uncharacterized protein n=1 Tax=Flavobacterium endophyticum TaxID=1540163 RepID=A0A495MJ11_9FLAO|nr:hypothetical protein [Flavobacterium endophyticum]RKS25408.1 hypothetical protein CLV94_0438 [Flavobacterium endophyticum]